MHLAESDMAVCVYFKGTLQILLLSLTSKKTGYDKRLLKKYSVMYG